MYSPRKQFLKFHYRKERWACLVCHRRAGKTVACINELLTRALATKKQHARYAYVAPFYKQAKTIAWDYLKHYGQDIIVNKNEAELWVEVLNANGGTARIYLFGADNADALRGIYLDGVILDEYADMKPSVWGTIIRPLLADRKGWAVFIGTPKGHNEFYKIYRHSKEDAAWFSMMLRASESGFVAQEELHDARRTMSEDQYEQEFECSFEAAIQGAIYGKWMKQLEASGRVRAGVYDPGLPVHTAWDLGYDDATSIWFWQVIHHEVRLLDYYENSGQDITHYCEIIKARDYQYGKHYVPHDAAYKLLAAGGRSIVEQAHALGIKMHVVPATTQQNAIEAARKTLEVTWIDSGCNHDGIEALKQYRFELDEDKKTFKSKPLHNWASHAADAFEIIGQVWRNPQTPKEPEKPRFLHEITANELFWSKDKPKSSRI